jgi:hypothetical protein
MQELAEASMSVCIAIELESGKYDEDEHASNVLQDLEHFDELEAELTRQGLRPLSEFVFHDAELLEEMLEYAPDATRENLQSQLDAAHQQPDWYDPREGVASVGKLIELLQERSIHQAAVSDLKSFQHVLVEAERTGDRFRLVAT